MNKKTIFKYIKVYAFSLIFILLTGTFCYAEEASVTFGAGEYTGEEESEIPINVRISTDVPMGEYYVEIHYDPNALTYVGGADKVDTTNGVVILQAPGNSSEISRRLTFKSDTVGESAIYTSNAIVLAPGTADQMYDITSEGQSRVSVSRKPEATPTPTATPTETPSPTAAPTTEPTSTPEINENASAVPTEEIMATPEPPGSLLDAVRNEALTSDEDVQTEHFQKAKKKDFLDKLTDAFPMLKGKTLYLIVGLIVLLSVVIVFLIVLVIKNLLKEVYDDYEYEEETEDEFETEIASKWDENDNDITWIDMPDKGDWNDEILSIPDEKPVISVKNVTMKYRISTSNASGIKEFLIQKVKRQVSYREFLALDNVNFDVYKGEVVGIIGTNGSGKSTILKIIAGALRPTSGNVVVDHKKIQILTLGTGFDMELTARENVYLNGSIIGYSKQFLDEHYDKIVEFAELEGFMEEKVKNFSSGMVSRLGFAIATAGDAAEILILDEVLSVGDEFFRKKSLARVQEMIHGGSTVLLVSHSMDTIKQNCTKVVWIEKGELRMVGEPKVVCEAYQKNGEKE